MNASQGHRIPERFCEASSSCCSQPEQSATREPVHFFHLSSRRITRFLAVKPWFALYKQRQAVGEGSAVCAAALRAFVRDHHAWCLPSFAAGVRRRAEQGPYAELVSVLAAWLPVERPFLGVPAPAAPVVSLPVEPAEEPAACEACAS